MNPAYYWAATGSWPWEVPGSEGLLMFFTVALIGIGIVGIACHIWDFFFKDDDKK